MSLKEEFEQEMKKQSTCNLDLLFLTSSTNYIIWLEKRIEELLGISK